MSDTKELSQDEKTLLDDILKMHVEGMDDAKETMVKDKATLASFEDFTTTFQIEEQQRETIKSIRRKLLEDDDIS